MRKIRKLGLFDSGLGGYTIYRDLKQHYPMLSLTLYADQKHAPIGNRSDDEIIEIASQAIEWFQSKGIYDVLLACNTATAVALPELHRRYKSMRIWGIIDLTIGALPANSKHVAVVATQATVSAHAYSKAYYRHHIGDIIEYAIPPLVKAIEVLAPQEQIDAIISEAIKNMPPRTHFILGCTHYPLVRASFEKAVSAEIIDSIEAIRNFIGKHGERDGLPQHRLFTTGDPVNMQKQIMTLFHVKEEVESA